MKSTTILDLMVKDHSKIIRLLNDVEKHLKQDTISLMNAFDKFEWALEKHIFTEEKAIFTSYNPTNILEGYKMVPELIKEHNEILNNIRVLRKDLIKHRPGDFNTFATILQNHRSFEEENLYPKLDQELSDSQKMMIISKITEIID